MPLLRGGRQKPDGGRSPVAAGDESRRSLLCSAEGRMGCARCCGLLGLAEGGDADPAMRLTGGEAGTGRLGGKREICGEGGPQANPSGFCRDYKM